MLCEGNKCKMWCMPLHRNVEDVRIQRHADELMCMIWGAMSHTVQYSRYQQVNPCMRHVLQWDQPTTPAKDAIKNPLTSCRAHGIMRMMCCVRARAVFHSWHLASWFYRVTKHGFKSVYIMLYVWDHAHQRMRGRTQDCTTLKKGLLYYSLFFHFAGFIILCVVL